MHLVAVLQLAWLSAAASQSCSSERAKFHKTSGTDCVRASFTRTVPGLCSELDCANRCAREPSCQAFRLMTNGSCECKLFVFDACSHRVHSEPNCTNLVTVYVRSVAGASPGRLCPPGYQHTRFGTSYKLVTSPNLTWAEANQSCSAEPGLSKFADAIDSNEALYLRSLKQLVASSSDFYVGGRLKTGTSANSKSNWVWAACNSAIDFDAWHSGEPNGEGSLWTGCTNLYRDFATGGIDDFGCDWSLSYICECQSVF